MAFSTLNRLDKSASLQRARQTAAAAWPDHGLFQSFLPKGPVTAAVQMKCGVCPSHFISAGDLWWHMCTVHNDSDDDDDDEEGRLECDRAGCGRQFDSLSALSAHWTLHLGVSSASGLTRKRSAADKCQLCGRMFGDQAALYRHMDTRHPEWRRDGVCNVCGRHVGVDVNTVLEHSMRDHCNIGSAGYDRMALQSGRSGPLRSRVQRRVHRSGNQLPYKK